MHFFTGGEGGATFYGKKWTPPRGKLFKYEKKLKFGFCYSNSCPQIAIYLDNMSARTLPKRQAFKRTSLGVSAAPSVFIAPSATVPEEIAHEPQMATIVDEVNEPGIVSDANVISIPYCTPVDTDSEHTPSISNEVSVCEESLQLSANLMRWKIEWEQEVLSVIEKGTRTPLELLSPIWDTINAAIIRISAKSIPIAFYCSTSVLNNRYASCQWRLFGTISIITSDGLYMLSAYDPDSTMGIADRGSCAPVRAFLNQQTFMPGKLSQTALQVMSQYASSHKKCNGYYCEDLHYSIMSNYLTNAESNFIKFFKSMCLLP